MNNQNDNTLEDNTQQWDDRELGASDQFVKVSTVNEAQIDDALGLQSISLRMPTDLLDDLKNIAALNQLGYQTLIKQVLKRFVSSEMKRIIKEQADIEKGRTAIAAEMDKKKAG